MKILKQGCVQKLDPTYKFECVKCSCQFFENKSECEPIQSYRNETVVSAKCPFCKTECFSDKVY